MKTARFFILVLVLLALASVPTAAAPLHSAPLRDFVAGPCGPGAAYDPACDVNHDNAIDIKDIQLTAGHWNQSGPWVSDNQHNHLGQTWTGSSNPLKLAGAFGAPDYAPLVLSNSAANGAGLRVSSAGKYGVSVGSAGNPSSTTASDLPSGLMVSGSQGHGLWVGRSDHNGVHVYSAGSAGVQVDQAANEGLRAVVAGDDGVQVDFAGNPSSWTYSNAKNGVEVAGAQGYGLFVGRADLDGVYVNSTAWHGINVSGAGVDGVYVSSPGDDGVEIRSAGNDGVHVVSAAHYGVLIEGGLGGIMVQETTGFAGYFYGDIVVTGTCHNCRIAQLGVNSGKAPLATGDVVAVTGVGANPLAVDNVLFEVKAATAGEPLIGVVTGKVEILTSPEDGTTNLVRRDGMVAQPGDYVSIVTYGPVQVKATGDVLLGDRVTVDETGSLRAMRRVHVEGVTLDEGGASLGLALDTAKDGLVWVLVNPQ